MIFFPSFFQVRDDFQVMRVMGTCLAYEGIPEGNVFG